MLHFTHTVELIASLTDIFTVTSPHLRNKISYDSVLGSGYSIKAKTNNIKL